MPTYRIIERSTGKRIGGAVVADAPFFSLRENIPGAATDPLFEEDLYTIEQTSNKPDAVVYTVVQQSREEGRNPWEVLTTGSRDVAVAEADRVSGGNGNGNGRGQAAIIEESPEVNRIAKKDRRS